MQRIREDFLLFRKALWRNRSLDLPGIHPLAPIDDEIADWIANGPKKSVTLALRGYGKTYTIAAYCCWKWLRDINCRILLVSKTEKEAKKTAELIRLWLEVVPFLRHLAPDGTGRDSALRFDIAGSKEDRSPSMSVNGIAGQLEGGRAHLVIGDDIETKENTKTRESRDLLNDRVKEFSAIASYGDREVKYIGTIHHEESLYLRLSERGYTVRTWPLTFPEPSEKQLGLSPIVASAVAEDPSLAGQPTMPHRFDEEYVNEKRAEGRRYFGMQYQLAVNLADTTQYPLRLRDLVVMDLDRRKGPTSVVWSTNHPVEGIPCLGFEGDGLYGPPPVDIRQGRDPYGYDDYRTIKMRIDPSGKGKDSTAYAVVAQLNGTLFALSVGSVPGGYSPETLTQLACIARDHRVTHLAVESNLGQGMFRDLLQPFIDKHRLEKGTEGCEKGWRVQVENAHSQGQKELRIIESLEPVMGAHRLVMSTAAVANEKLQYQLTRITTERNSLEHDDELEALAMAVADHAGSVGMDSQVGAARSRKNRIEYILERAMKKAGRSRPKPKFFTYGKG